MRRFLLAGLMTFALPAHARQVTCDAIRAAKTKVYGFHPAELSETAAAAKSKEIDAFWKQVQIAGSSGAACLGELLQAEKTDHYFQFDGASLLFQLDHSKDSLTVIRDAIAQADFQESDPASYLSLSLSLSQAGVDIGPLAGRLLRFPNVEIQVPEHSLDLDPDTAAIFLYGSMPPALADKYLIADLQAPEPLVREAAAHLLAEQLTPESFQALSKWAAASKIVEEFRRNDIRTVMSYQAPEPADLANTKFTRVQVLQVIAGLPHTNDEFDEALRAKGAAFDQQSRDHGASQEQIAQAIAEGEPIYGIAGHTAFLRSAVATLKEADLETLRAARREAVHNISDQSLEEYLAFTQVMIGLINRLDLYKEYRAH